MPVKQTMNNTLSKDLAIRPEYLGTPQLLAPFVHHTSSQRGMMYSSHLSQALVLDGAEQPRIMTGYEKVIGNYEITSCRVEQDMIIRKIRIMKFREHTF